LQANQSCEFESIDLLRIYLLIYNQLDRASVKWLEQYLIAHSNVTCLIISHDSGYVLLWHLFRCVLTVLCSFLDNVTTDIIHYETKKVNIYYSNVWTPFRSRVTKSSYTTQGTFLPLSLNTLKRSRTILLLRPLSSLHFLLPDLSWESAAILARFWSWQIALSHIPVGAHQACSTSAVRSHYRGMSSFIGCLSEVTTVLRSRVGIIGPNGAGKSTLVKLLTVSFWSIWIIFIFWLSQGRDDPSGRHCL
jgi:elongation factor 3